jgi:hypothetical protein
MLPFGACADLSSSGSGQAGADGLYLGSDVSFRLADGVIYDVRFSHIECRVPHPENARVALCLLRPDGQPADTLAVSGHTIQGRVGDLDLDGEFEGSTASGIWAYEATCFDGTTCESEGTWTATWTAEPGGSQPDGPLRGTEPGSPIGEDLDQESGDGTEEEEASEPAGQPGTPADGASELQLTAWEAFESVRLEAGIAMPTQDDAINQAAQAHADYFSLHAEAYYTSGLNPHEENPEWEDGFSGVGIGDRLSFHGVTGGQGWGEVMAFTGTAQGAVDGWMATLYHRIPFVHPNTQQWGFGIAADGAHCEVMDYTMGAAMASGATSWTTPGQLGVPWPAPGAVDVDTSWNGAESPQPPLPDGASYPSGPVVTLTFANGASPVLDSASLVGPEGQVPAQVQTPDNDPWLSSSWALYALDPLEAKTVYTLHFQGTVSGESYDASWTFETR